MKIASINTDYIGGGAAKVARLLHEGAIARGHDSRFLSRYNSKSPASENVMQLGPDYAERLSAPLNPLVGKIPGAYRVKRALRHLTGPASIRNFFKGYEDFEYPDTWNMFEKLGWRPDIVHLHNLHGNFFDLRFLPELSKKTNVVITPHDEWLMTGHCAYTLGCERWKTGCGQCPDLKRYPSLMFDGTAANWNRKKGIYDQSRLYMSAPCEYILNLMNQSIIAPAIQKARVIYNGVDTDTFQPGDKNRARQEFEKITGVNLPDNAPVLLAVANNIKGSIYKDIQTLRSMMQTLGKEMAVTLIAFGSTGETEHYGRAKIIYVPYSKDQSAIIHAYQAADIFVHAAKAEIFPLVILEAMACGKPVVATNVGGIGEQIVEGHTGFLVHKGDAATMAERVRTLLQSPEMAEEFGQQGRTRVEQHFTLQGQIEKTLSFYHAVQDNQSP